MISDQNLDKKSTKKPIISSKIDLNQLKIRFKLKLDEKKINQKAHSAWGNTEIKLIKILLNFKQYTTQ